MSDDISDICKYNPDLEDDDKSCRLDWDDSATFIDERTGEEELAAFISPQIVIEEGYLEPVIVDNYDHTFTTKTDKNGRTLYYIDGERRSHADYMYQLEQRQGLIDELPDKRMRWLNKPEDIYEDATTLESVSGLEGDEHINAKVAERYVKIEGATVQSVEETAPEVNPDEYIITQEAFDEAVEDAELEALFAKWTAETLSDPRIEAAYRKARERVEVEFTNYGIPLYTYIKKNGERCYEDFVAKSYISKCGLSETDFIVKARAEAKITRDRRTEKIGSDEVYYVGDKWQCTYSAKYHASFFRSMNSGELMYRVDDLTIVSEQDFWATMIERGACTIDLTVAEKLTAELKKVTRKSRLMDIYPQVGGRIVAPLYNVEIVPDGGGFIFTNGHETLARYDTKEQCLDVIERIKTAIEGYDTEFEFPTAELVDLEKKLPALMIEQFNKYRYRSKGRSIPRRFLAAQLKYYGLTPAQLKEAYHA